MLKSLGSWSSKAKVAGSPVEEFRFGSVRIARIVAEYKNMIVKGEEKKFRMFQYRIFLPGVGAKDVSYAWSMDEAKAEVEDVILDWMFETGFAALVERDEEPDEAPIVETAVVIPESIVVLQGVGAPPASAKILPLEDWRAKGKERPKSDPSPVPPWKPAAARSQLPMTNVKSSKPIPRRRSLTRGK